MGTRKQAGRRVAALRVALGMTQGELAHVAHVHVGTVVRAEAGEPIGRASRDRLAAVLGPLAYKRIPVRTWAEMQPALPADAPPALLARYERQLSLTAAADAIGIGRDALRRAERGGHIQMRTARAIAEFYELPVGRVYVLPEPHANDAAVAQAMAGAVIALVVAFVAWRLDAHRRRLRRREGERALVRAAHDERAARARLRPSTGAVDAAPIHPPTNGKHQ